METITITTFFLASGTRGPVYIPSGSVYLTNPEGGSTVCEGEEFTGKEDDAIIFEGKHYNYPPKRGRRMVIVATFSDYD